MGSLSTYTVHDLVVMAESNGSHPECSQVPTAAISQELASRVLALEEAVRVLAAEAACGRIAWEGSVLMWDTGEQQGSYPLLPTQWGNAERATDNNPIARAAVEKARGT